MTKVVGFQEKKRKQEVRDIRLTPGRFSREKGEQELP